MQYTEENYTELYNNLPKGLRDLVLSGELTNLSNAIAIKYGLTPEQTSDLEPAIEDVALGLVTVEELKDNVAFQLNLNENQADTLSREIIKTILNNHIEELRLTRKYKLELDEKIRKQKSNNTNEVENTNIFANKQNVAENIISATKESRDFIDNTNKKTLGEELLYNSDKKVSDWYAGGKTKTQMELDSFTGNIAVNNVKVKREGDVITQAPAREKNIETKKTEIKSEVKAEAKAEPKINNNTNADVWNNLISENSETKNTQNNNSSNATSKSLESSMVQVEQQIFTLTQSINKLLTQDTFSKNKTAVTSIENVFDTDEYKTLNDKLDSLNKRIDDMQSEMQILKIDKTNNTPKAVSFSIANVMKDDLKTGVDDNKAEEKNNKKEFDIEDLLKNRSVSNNNQVNKVNINSSIVSEGAMSAILENRKSNISESGTPQIRIPEIQTEVPALEIAKGGLKIEENMVKKLNSKDALLDDLNFLKTENENLDNSKLNLKQEILPENDNDRMKSLQDKIKSLNKGIGYGGISSAINLDPYKQAI